MGNWTEYLVPIRMSKFNSALIQELKEVRHLSLHHNIKLFKPADLDEQFELRIKAM